MPHAIVRDDRPPGRREAHPLIPRRRLEDGDQPAAEQALMICVIGAAWNAAARLLLLDPEQIYDVAGDQPERIADNVAHHGHTADARVSNPYEVSAHSASLIDRTTA
jgi:hypothetical protein